MSEMQVIEILNKYRHCLNEHREMCTLINEIPLNTVVKAWLKLLPKEDRIIVHMKLIHGYDWRNIQGALESRWGDAGKRTEADLEKRMSKAISSIASFMGEYFPMLN